MLIFLSLKAAIVIFSHIKICSSMIFQKFFILKNCSSYIIMLPTLYQNSSKNSKYKFCSCICRFCRDQQHVIICFRCVSIQVFDFYHHITLFLNNNSFWWTPQKMDTAKVQLPVNYCCCTFYNMMPGQIRRGRARTFLYSSLIYTVKTKES